MGSSSWNQIIQLQSVKNISVTGPRKGIGYRGLKNKISYVGALPFLALTAIFLVYPTIYVILGAFKDLDGKISTSVLTKTFFDEATRNSFGNTLELSAKTAILGAVLGALVTWAVASGKEGFFKKIVLSLSGVLSQFGGVMLTFAFLATFGFNGLVSSFVMKYFPENILAQSTWIYGINGLTVVYTFFQIPLMVLVFFPSFENIRKEWREASNALGGNTFEYWSKIGIPVLFPSFLGSTLLLFSNSFSAYATAASLITNGTFLTPLQIADSLSSEIGGANAATASSLSLFMVIVVLIVMTIYTIIRRKVSKWEQSE